MSKYLVALSLFSMLFFAACSTEENVDEGTASLVVKVTFEDNSNAMDATVDLYESQQDYLDKTNLVATLITDELGEAYFKELALKQYWFYCYYDDKDNANSIFSTGKKLIKDERLEKLTQIRK